MSSSPRPKHLCRCRRLYFGRDLGDGIRLLSFSDRRRTLASSPSGAVLHYGMIGGLVASSDSEDLAEVVDDMVRSCLAQEVLWS